MTETLAADGHLVFDGALTMRCVTSHFARLKQAVEQHDVIFVDCHSAEEVDLTFVQLLVAARKTAERTQQTICLSGPAEGTLFDTLRRAGFIIHQEKTQSSSTGSDTFWFGEGTA